MSRALLPLCALLALACSSGIPTVADDDNPSDVLVNGSLRLTVTDTIGGTVLLPRPTASASSSKITVINSRYGSRCRYAVDGRADVQGSVVTLHITYTQRLTVCTEELRILSYRAEIGSLAARTYDLTVIHEESGRRDTVLAQRIGVP